MQTEQDLSLFGLFQTEAAAYPEKKALYFKTENNYLSLTYGDLLSLSCKLGNFFANKGLKKGDHIAIIMENSHLWPISLMAALSCSLTAVPLNPQLDFIDIHFFLTHSNTKFMVISKPIYDKYRDAFKESTLDYYVLENLAAIKTMPDYERTQKKVSAKDKDSALIVYTSGTTEDPKGVVLSHKNLISNIDSIKKMKLMKKTDCVISFLPLYHTYSLMVTCLLPLLIGASISYPKRLELTEITDCLKQTRTSFFVGVPSIFSLVHEKIKKRIQTRSLSSFFLQALINLLFELRKITGINLAKPLLKPVHGSFPKELRFLVSGGAKLPPRIILDFFKWGFTVIEGYGLTETSPVVSFSRPNNLVPESVGKAIPDVKISITDADENGIGEIAIQGENVFSEYYKQKKITTEALENGWFKTGDLGSIDKKGFLFITGRKKEIIVLPSGENIIPSEVEAHYSQSKIIKEICVFSDEPIESSKQETLSAVILPDYEKLAASQVTQIKDKVRWEIENLSRTILPFKRIQNYLIITEELEKTPLGKIKRYAVKAKYSPLEKQQEKQKEISESDQAILEDPKTQTILDFLTKELNRPVSLADHLELDLGLDSLEQIGIFIELQKHYGTELKEEDFTGLSTVKEVVALLKNTSETTVHKTDSLDWQKVLTQNPDDKLQPSVCLTQSLTVKILSILLLGILKTITFIFFRLKVKGKKNLPKTGPYLICPNHTSFLDGPIVAAALDIRTILSTYFLGSADYLNSPLIRWANKLLRLVAIEPNSNITEQMTTSAFILNNKKNLCVFPEGARSPNGEISDFKRGTAILIKELNIPVIPVIISGAYDAWPPFQKRPRCGTIKLVFGERIEPQDLSALEGNGDVYKTISEKLREKLISLQKSL
ncbi:MAG: AMP-binding protein [Candidatus Omnitrophica bacterium]|nr:AMP-binding protein [Candidatus Omnitrophota bacterium]